MSIKSLSSYCFGSIARRTWSQLTEFLAESLHADPAIFSVHFVHHLESR